MVDLVPIGVRRDSARVRLTADMQRVVDQQRLGFVATVTPDGRPNLSPKGTTVVWDDEHLMFADIVSPGTVANLASNPNVEVNVVDPIVRKGYRFRGLATVHRDGEGLRARARGAARARLHDRARARALDRRHRGHGRRGARVARLRRRRHRGRGRRPLAAAPHRPAGLITRGRARRAAAAPAGSSSR